MSISKNHVEDGLKWLTEPHIKVMTHMLRKPWEVDAVHFDPVRWAAGWQKAGVTAVHLLAKDDNGLANFRSSLRPHPDRDYFGDQVEELTKRHLKVVAYYIVAIDNYLGGSEPDWVVKRRNGEQYIAPMGPARPADHWLCLNSPYFEMAISEINELVRNYSVDCVWLDILRYPNPPGQIQDDVCFCKWCRKAYNSWTGGESIEFAAGTEKLLQFHGETYRRFVQATRDVIEAQERPVALSYNGSGKWLAPGYEHADALVDFASMEGHNPTRRTVMGRFLRGLGLPFELTSPGQMTWMHSVNKPDCLLQLEAASTLVHGGNVGFGVYITRDALLTQTKVERIEKVGSWLAAQGDVFSDTVPVYDVAVAAYKADLGVSSSTSAGSDRSGYELFPQWANLLMQGHFLFTILEDANELNDFQVIVLPSGRPITDKEATTLRQYVAAGGNLLIEAPAARVGGDGPYVLEDLMGVKFTGISELKAHFIQVTETAVSQDVSTADPFLVIAGAELVKMNGAQPVAILIPPLESNKSWPATWLEPYDPDFGSPIGPAATLHQVGKGRVIYCTVPITLPDMYDPPMPWAKISSTSRYGREFAEAVADNQTNPWPRTFAQNLVRWLLANPTVEVQAPPRVELVLNRKGDRHILHFLNHGYAPGRYIESRGERDQLGPMPVLVDEDRLGHVARVRLVPENVVLDSTRLGKQKSFTLPSLGIYRAVELACRPK